jgi:hypothetical protein
VVPAAELAQMLDAFAPFDARMAEGTRARRTKDHGSPFALKWRLHGVVERG